MGIDDDLGRLCGFVCGGRCDIMSIDRANETPSDICRDDVLKTCCVQDSPDTRHDNVSRLGEKQPPEQSVGCSGGFVLM